ncbi:unnamed protein product, partial [Heterotrigona itama]
PTIQSNSIQFIETTNHQCKISLAYLLGRGISRSYTPVPPCLHPDDMPKNYTTTCLCLMVKKYPNGTLSPSITSLQIGEILLLSGVAGAFVLENFDCYPVIHMLAAGTGLTVMLGIIQRALVRRTVSVFSPHFLKFKVTHILSQPKDTWTGRRGMVSVELLEELVGRSNPDACVFTCGPSLFMQAAKT